MRTLSPDLNNISVCRLNLRGIIAMLLLTAVYFVCFFYLPQKMRYLLFAGTALVVIFFVRPKPGFWLPLLPLVFMAGGSTLPTGSFNIAIATMVMTAFTFFYI
ncbi:MAG: hypothetical protein KAT09_01235, partial [Candidatus Aegiribacteria sp.]|nr:hypothetical protein [Candidatus Aegiribacteria sp.]